MLSHALVIPCFNEAKRLKVESYKGFITTHPSVLVCFVNDGSSDNTLAVLQSIKNEFSQNVCIVENLQNMGIGETVRAGINHVLTFPEIEEAGFLDADLSTDFDEYIALLKQFKTKASYLMVFGSRQSAEGVDINYNPFRLMAAKISRFIVRRIIKLPIIDTQCGAKIFSREASKVVFQKPFETRWLFDVEVIVRLQQHFGMQRVVEDIHEFFVAKWTHEPDSKLVLWDMINMPYQFLKIFINYKVNPFKRA